MAAGQDRGPARLDVASLAGTEPADLHLLPCRVEHRGAAAVGRYFAPAIRRSTSQTQRDGGGGGGGAPEELSVSFRGRSLKGIPTSVPEGYVGLVLLEEEDDEAPLLLPGERQLCVKSTFQSLMVWNLERGPNGTDEIMMALHWPKIAEGIHAPVADE